MTGGRTRSSTDSDGDARAAIDRELLELFDDLTQYQQMRDSANQELKHAYFDLALARRSAGYRWISPDLYSGRARAIATASVDPDTGRVSVVRRELARARTSKGRQQHQENKEDEGRSGLRQRRQKKDTADKEPGNNDDGDQERVLDDPLLWFGMLVPPSLKDAQRGFATSLDLLVALAQAKGQLTAKQQGLQHRISQIEKQQPQSVE
ncbi:hypothetical protein H4R99_005904 [Coemansia sp. RSA 1722]|nr:hypothetical protein LPJ57_009974 [Coemansia sp. RSA 486]KAJ2594103.1 hypothetical protein H4R99_005904 [Coemansia sp. RSA 1722]